MENHSIRINKYLAEAGVCSRRQADGLIAEGLVTINGRMAEAGTKVGAEDEVRVRNKPVHLREQIHVIAYYKPVGVTCTERDVHAKKTVIRELGYPVRVTYAGRLDRDSEGLLLMTNDGGLIDGLMRASNFHEKEYLVKTDREITDEFLQQMAEGVYLKELDQRTRPCMLYPVGKYTFQMILTQGLNRQIRRMCETLGYKVTSLKRIRVANIELGSLRPGEYRRLEEAELQELYDRIRKKEENRK